MTLQRALILAATAVVSFATAARAGADDVQHESSDATLLRREATASVFPIEDVLKSLSARTGVAFIFDSRLLIGKKMPMPDPAREFTEALERGLRAADLALHRVGEGAYAIAPAAGSAASAPIPQLAVEAEARVDTILVTATAAGARLAAGDAHLIEITRDDLAFLTSFATDEAIYALPQSLESFSPANTSLLGALSGVSFADLRGMDPARTLVLVNGRARTITLGGNGTLGGVDLNAIPEPFLERIEIVAAPGGARFGPRAAAGTINFVTRADMGGFKLDARSGISERGDHERVSLTLHGGARLFGETADVSFGVHVARIEGLIGADRASTAAPYGFATDGRQGRGPGAVFLPGFGGSSTTGRGLITGVLADDGSIRRLPGGRRYIPLADGTLEPFVGALDQLYNGAAELSTLLPSDKVVAYLDVEADMAGGGRLLVEAHAGVSATDVRLAPLPGGRLQGFDPVTGDAAVIPLDNPTVPAAIRQFIADGVGPSADAILLDRRYVEMGPRSQQAVRSFADIYVGAEFGDKDRALASVGYRFGANEVRYSERNRIDARKLDISLDPAACSATPDCALADFFDPSGLSLAAVGFLRAPPLRRTLVITEHSLLLKASAEVAGAGGETGPVTASAEMTNASFSDLDHTTAGVIPIGGFLNADPSGDLTTADFAVAADLPVVRGARFIGEMDVSTAFRLTPSNPLDAAMNFEGAIALRPFDGLALYTRHHVGARTPNIVELFNAGQSVERSFTDPCASPATTTVAANCASATPFGVAPGFVQTSFLAADSFFGNPDLEPEEVRSDVYGVTLSPLDVFSFPPGRLSLSAAWLDYRIRNAVGFSSDPLADCYGSAGLSSLACAVNPRTGAPAIRRDPVSQQVVAVDSLLYNGGEFVWRGLDLELRYAFEPADAAMFDRAWISAFHSYAEKVEIRSASGSVQQLDGLYQQPRHRTLIGAGLDRGPISLTLAMNRRGRARSARIDVPEARLPATAYFDASIAYRFGERASVRAGVENIADKEPPIVAFNPQGGNTFKEHYDIVGRRFNLGFEFRF